MEEDLKILEEFIEDYSLNEELADDHFIDALENLIKGYRELQDRVIKYEKTLENLQKETIWKSKIKEKIEEVNKSLGYSPVNKILIEQVLQELMGDK